MREGQLHREQPCKGVDLARAEKGHCKFAVRLLDVQLLAPQAQAAKGCDGQATERGTRTNGIAVVRGERCSALKVGQHRGGDRFGNLDAVYTR